MRVADVFGLYTTEHATAAPDTAITEVIAGAARDRGSRAVFVVGDDQRLLGIIRMREILRRVGRQHVVSRSFGRAKDILATRARDIMIEPVAVAPSDDVDKALRIAVQFDLEDVPVVENDRLVGQIDCFELLHGLGQLRA
jgi:CBS domain-containing protein